MDINQIQKEIIDEFSVFDEWMDKYAYLIELGKEIPKLDEKLKTNERLISGCQSNVWITAEYKDGKVYFTADSDAIITKGLVSLLIRVYSGQTPDDIINTDPYFIKEIGLDNHLSPTRNNGLASMVKQIKLYALAYKAKNNLK
ncbi:MAG: SufE family protein [Marinilabiliales bacterium]